ncbi:KAP family P-loop NTPase fold protein [Archangium violaceum]|uniref:KAP family P-loop NTPase fold protein n=1 Tax=Archangium violaceum TaxID=83451 RepID=UPI0031B8AC37
MVVSLTGPWGSGKSSIVNFVVEILQKEAAKNNVDILRFNPWQSADQATSGGRLLREIAVALQYGDKSEENKKIALKWSQWAAALNLSTSTFDAYSKTPITLVISGLLTTGALAASGHPTIEAILQFAAMVAIVIGLFLQSSAVIAEKAAAFFNSRAAATERTLDDLKTELRSVMGRRGRQLIVIIDDIDRLPQPEVQSLLRAVRANADFPSLVFLLVFERAVVEQAIADQAHVDGSEYLKKIIQVPFSIPASSPIQVQKLFVAALNEVIGEIPNTVPFDQRRWGNLLVGGVNHYFVTLRDVYRYMATFEFHLGMFRGGKTLEINQIDLIGLEVLRVFEARVYEALPRFRKLLLEGPGQSSLKDRKSLARRELDELVALSQKPENHSAVKQILSVIFQPVEWLLSGYGYGSGFEERWERDLRACSETHFSRYFHLSLSEGDISQAEIEAVLNAVFDRPSLVAELKRLSERGLLEAMFDRLEAYKETIDTRAAVPFVTALFDVGDGLRSASQVFDVSPEMHAVRVVFWFLRRIPSEAERENTLATAIKETTGLQLPVSLVSLEERRENKAGHEYLVSEARLPELKSLCVDKITAASRTGYLIDHPEVATLMFRWLHWTDGAAPRAWATSMASNSYGALALVRGFTRDVYFHSLGDKTARSRPQIGIEEIECFLPVETLVDSLAKIDSKALKGRELEAFVAFGESVENRKREKTKGESSKR